ncbi:MAG: sugar ABC transporter substrate-binding protein [Limnochordales bacterium]|nr:sugar ABC transporter substrate-binding protein [Limnochordales bacterium]
MRCVRFCRKAWPVVLLLVLSLLGAAQAVAAARKTLELATYGDPIVDGEVWAQIKAAFEKRYPQYELKITVTPYVDYISKLTTLFAGGQAPDVFQTWAQYKPAWAEDGLLLDLTSRVEKSSLVPLREFFPVVEEMIRYKGRIWGTPHDFSAMIWYVNVDLLDDAGVPVPGMRWTVDDLRAAAMKVVRPERQIYGTTNPVGWGGLNNLQWTYNFTGHYWLTPDGSDVAVDDEGTARMLRFWYEMVWKYKVTPPPSMNWDTKNSWNGYVGLWEAWLSQFRNLEEVRRGREAAGRKMFRWTILPFPAGPYAQADFAQGHMWSIPANHPNPDDAWKLAEWLASREAEVIFTRNQKAQPLRPDEELWDSWLSFLPRAQAQQLKVWVLQYLFGTGIAKNFNYWRTYNEMASVMSVHLVNIFSHQRPIENEMKAAAAEMRQILKRQKK